MEYLTIVSGLPRSGTSMMMRMLEAGGMPVIVDGIRTPDEDNPQGYYEFEPAKSTKSDSSWLEGATGKAVKMVYKLLYDLPAQYQYRILFMRRDTDEILASQEVMLDRHQKQAAVPAEVLKNLFEKEIEKVRQWLDDQQNFDVLYVNYNEVLAEPQRRISRIAKFLTEADLDVAKMVSVVDASLYRNRA